MQINLKWHFPILIIVAPKLDDTWSIFESFLPPFQSACPFFHQMFFLSFSYFSIVESLIVKEKMKGKIPIGRGQKKQSKIIKSSSGRLLQRMVGEDVGYE